MRRALSEMPDDQRTRHSPDPNAADREGPVLTLLEGGAAQPPPTRRTARDGRDGRGGHAGHGRPRVKRLRLAVILFGLGALALISTIFGMMMAVAQDLPSLEGRNEFKRSENSILRDVRGKQLAVLTGNENRILVDSEDISPSIKHAVIAVEDQRFYSHKGLDYQAIARALWADIRRQKAVQGGSTITQQLIKNALVAQTNRSLFQKLKEAALAYQLERKWSKDKILTQYLNAVYFGEGAYGVESAARVYFGALHPGCEPNCARVLDPAEAALLAGMIASPTAYSPVLNPPAALERRNLVLEKMRDLDLLSPVQYRTARERALPSRDQINPPRKISKSPYFSSWVEEQLVERYGTGTTFGGGLDIRTSLDLDLQAAAEQAVSRIAGIGPSAALVALDNKTGGVRAMVGGTDFEHQPFNLATQGHRQPGSAFKPFTLVAALEKGISPGRTFVSAKKTVDGSRGPFEVENYEDRYSGVISLAGATTVSDNSVYAEVGYKLVGTEAVARTARRMGIRTQVSRNPAMILGGLRRGVTPLELAQSYLTLARGGNRVYGSLSAYDKGPVALTEVKGGGIHDENTTRTDRVVPEPVAQQVTQILQTVIAGGTGRSAAIGEFAAGKTGTTENYLDALFVGYTESMTVAVWVGYPTGGRPMETEYRGEPVAGGTYPAEIWRDFMLSVNKIRDARAAERDAEEGPTGPTTVAPAEPVSPDSGSEEKPQRKARKQRESSPAEPRREQQPAQPEPQAEPEPQQQTPPSSGGSGGSGGAGAGGDTPLPQQP
jgi:penicillin-binding protein 1A